MVIFLSTVRDILIKTVPLKKVGNRFYVCFLYLIDLIQHPFHLLEHIGFGNISGSY
ncbi:MAG: hypothetical protein A4E53_04377 [Pelotomaculum sp. PtaB.Bin104]|nr:MAG: hypothetical protein A4E53_04377 [Pelotomaculum sp. PtaB.Bin104]